jgi:hypothetical protein
MPSKYGFDTEEDREIKRRKAKEAEAREKAKIDAQVQAERAEKEEIFRRVSGAVRDVLLDYATATYPHAKDDHKVTEDFSYQRGFDAPLWLLGSSPEHLLYKVALERRRMFEPGRVLRGGTRLGAGWVDLGPSLFLARGDVKKREWGSGYEDGWIGEDRAVAYALHRATGLTVNADGVGQVPSDRPPY